MISFHLQIISSTPHAPCWVANTEQGRLMCVWLASVFNISDPSESWSETLELFTNKSLYWSWLSITEIIITQLQYLNLKKFNDAMRIKSSLEFSWLFVACECFELPVSSLKVLIWSPVWIKVADLRWYLLESFKTDWLNGLLTRLETWKTTHFFILSSLTAMYALVPT